jgi:DNA-binding MarR family transcriptional regulator
MSNLAVSTRTVPAFPLGQPVDGRARYGMTPEQAFVYRWIVRNRPHDAPFPILFRELAQAMALREAIVHMHVVALVERGWLESIATVPNRTLYRLVHPVMRFRGRR